MLDIFPADEQDTIRYGIADNLRVIVCQRLMHDTKGLLLPAVEIMVNTPTVRNLIQNNQLNTLPAAVATGREDGMLAFDQCIYDLIQGGLLSEDEGMRHASNPESLRMNLKGIFLDESRRILST